MKHRLVFLVLFVAVGLFVFVACDEPEADFRDEEEDAYVATMSSLLGNFFKTSCRLNSPNPMHLDNSLRGLRTVEGWVEGNVSAEDMRKFEQEIEEDRQLTIRKCWDLRVKLNDMVSEHEVHYHWDSLHKTLIPSLEIYLRAQLAVDRLLPAEEKHWESARQKVIEEDMNSGEIRRAYKQWQEEFAYDESLYEFIEWTYPAEYPYCVDLDGEVLFVDHIYRYQSDDFFEACKIEEAAADAWWHLRQIWEELLSGRGPDWKPLEVE